MKPSNPFVLVVSPGDRVRETVASRRQASGFARGLHLFRAVLPVLLIAVACSFSTFSTAQVPVLTYHGDNNRSGMVNETLLTPNNVNYKQFGRLGSYSVDQYVVAQPLYVPNVNIPGQGTHNVLYVATQNDTVYAFDADNPGVTLWSTSFIDASADPPVNVVPIVIDKCPSTGFTDIGIMGTPVIDPATGTMFVSAKTMTGTGKTATFGHTMHALDITTGLEKFGSPVQVAASFTAPNTDKVTFLPLPQFQRPALLLSKGVVYAAFGSNGCDLNAYGWIFAFDAGETSGTLQQLGFFNTAPDTGFASIWQSGNGPAADSNGNIYSITANGMYDLYTGGPDLGDTFLKLSFASNTFTLEDSFTPEDQANMEAKDLDLGSGGPLLIPGTQSGPYPDLLVGGGKTGTIYLINRDNMGGYDTGPSGGNGNVQDVGPVGPIFSSPVYWNSAGGQMVYFAPFSSGILGYSLTNGQLSTTPVVTSGNIGVAGVPTLSANGPNNGIFWITVNPAKPFLAAYDATSLVELYSSNQDPSRDSLNSLLPHFITPLVANGKVYVGTESTVVVYGLLPFLAAASGTSQTCTVGSALPLPITVEAENSSGVGVQGVTVTFSDGNKGGTFSNPTGTTNGTGTVTTSYTCPTKSQSITVTATASGYTSVLMRETAVAGPPTAIAIVSGGGQTGTHGQPLPSPIVARVHDVYTNSVPNIPITFTAKTGSFSPSTPVNTGANGEASVIYTCPVTPGKVTITASYPGGSKPANAGETCQ
jgi:hypothetical protein